METDISITHALFISIKQTYIVSAYYSVIGRSLPPTPLLLSPSQISTCMPKSTRLTNHPDRLQVQHHATLTWI